jgi:hypothetical protein
MHNPVLALVEVPVNLHRKLEWTLRPAKQNSAIETVNNDLA